MKKRGIAFLLGLNMFLLTACGDGKIQEPLYQADTKANESINLPVAEEKDNTLEVGINQFAYQFYDAMGSTENIFFSPYSICGAISLLDVGAGSETKDQIEKMLGISNLEEWNKQMKLYLEKSWGEETKLLTTNSLWIAPYLKRSENIEIDFLQPAAFYYKSEAFEADFANDGAAVVKSMNLWVDKNTNGMLPEYKKEVDPDTIMTILNAVYFEGKWLLPFLEADTREDGTFTNSSGENRSEIPMMNQYEQEFQYLETEGWKGIELPYKDSSVVMDILMPIEDSDYLAVQAYQELTVEEQEKLWSSFDDATKETIQILSMPRFTMDLTVEGMDDILKSMGMTLAYAETADFDKIGRDTFVSSVAHRAKIEVDEQGTKAAAVTEITMQETALDIDTKVVDFIMDRPFLYIIKDTDTGLILFMGQVIDF